MEAIKKLRMEREMTQTDLAAAIGVTQSVVAMWERGAVMPAAGKLPDIADALGCSIDALFGRDRKSSC